ncbi:MAG: hypothetical protein J6U04_02225 [Salinivirgaceae bacterium]|nr:hypothetical protein [Salinivirgaceae bacterium]
MNSILRAEWLSNTVPRAIFSRFDTTAERILTKMPIAAAKYRRRRH